LFLFASVKKEIGLKDFEMKLYCVASPIAVAIAALSCLPVRAALPSEDVYNSATSQYTLLLHQSRDGCGYYANPKTLSVNGNQRYLSVLLTRGDPGGSACNGVFEFQVLSVNCQAQQVSYSNRIHSPADWVEEWHPDRDVADKVCSILP
jgi:hypothetical protein